MSKIQINSEFLEGLVCNKEDHQNKPIEFICKSPDCPDRLNCLHCLLNEHSGHFIDMQLFKNFFDSLEEQKPESKNQLSSLMSLTDEEINPEKAILNFQNQISNDQNEFEKELSGSFKEFETNILKVLSKIQENNQQSIDFFSKKLSELKECQIAPKSEPPKKELLKSKQDLMNFLAKKYGKNEENIQESDSTLKLILELKTLQLSSIKINEHLVEKLKELWKNLSLTYSNFNEKNLSNFSFLRMKDYVPSSEKDIQSLTVQKTINTGHKKSIYRIVFLENEQKFATASDDSTIVLWSISGTSIHTFTGHSDRIWTLIKLGEFRLASGSSDHKIKIWNTEKLVLERTLSWHTAFVCALMELPENQLISGSHDKCLKVWNYISGKQIRSFKGENQGKIMKIIWLNMDQICVGSDSNINIYNFNEGKVDYTMTSHTSLVRDLLLMDNLETLFSSSDDHKIKMWNLKRRECVRTFSGHTHSANRILFFNKTVIVTASDDSTIKFWNMNNGSQVRTLTGHSSWVIFITILKDGTLVSVGADKIVRFWR